jgi:hypothetical protein
MSSSSIRRSAASAEEFRVFSDERGVCSVQRRRYSDKNEEARAVVTDYPAIASVALKISPHDVTDISTGGFGAVDVDVGESWCAGKAWDLFRARARVTFFGALRR